MRRPVRSLLPLLVALALLAAACGDDDDEETTAGAGGAGAPRTVRGGVLTVCSDIPYAPFEYEEGGKAVGIDIELMEGIAAEMGLRAQIRDTDFDGIFAALAADQCDVIASSVSITDERRQNNEFTQGYFEIQQSLLVRKEDGERYKSLEDLAGRTIGVQSGTTGEAYAQENAPEGVTVKSFTGADEMFTALKAKQVDALLQDYPVNAYNAQSTGETVVSARLESDPEEYGFVIKKGNTELRDSVDDALSALRDSGRYKEILEKYLGEGAAS